jgi:GNAT superfamily N-acetyltransferase
MNQKKMGTWTIRRAELRDADALSDCIDAAYADYAVRIPDLPPVSADCAGEIAMHQVWVAEVAKDIVGGVVLIPGDGFMRLANVAVHPDHKGTGLGRALITHAETESLTQGYRELCLTTHVDMPENVRLYAHLGWERVGMTGRKVAMKKSL